MWVLADRLAQPEGAWEPFKPHGVAGSLYERMASLMQAA
jgi:hypothetical protein